MPTYLCEKYLGAKRLGRKWCWGRNDYGMWGETTRVENRGETTRGKDQGGNVLGAKRLVTKNKTGKLDHSSTGPEMVIDRNHP